LELPDRGLGNAPAVRGLLRCHIAEEADILFLLETKLDEKRMIVLKKKLGVENLEVVDCEGKGEGLAVLWRRGISVVLRVNRKTTLMWRSWRLVDKNSDLLGFMANPS